VKYLVYYNTLKKNEAAGGWSWVGDMELVNLPRKA
jgi:hypothetical protein